MGKYSTYRKRGGSTAPLLLPPPPAPILTDTDGYLHQRAEGEADPGGSIWLQNAEFEEGPWSPYGSDAWASDYNWGELAGLPTGFYRAMESGNGIIYSGMSAPSNIHFNES
jgi:hypothetical protein